MYQNNLKEAIENLSKAPIITVNLNNISREEIVQKLKEISIDGIKNKFTGVRAEINRVQRDKILSNIVTNKSIANGFSRLQHYIVVSEIEKLFNLSVIVATRKDRNHDPNIVSIKCFITPFIMNDTKGYVSMLLKETKEHENKIYTLEVQKLEDVKRMLEEYFKYK